MLSLSAQFFAWCRSKPADERYNPLSVHRCALGQFGVVGGRRSCERQGIPRRVYAAALSFPWTFGALADRVERQLAEQGQVS